MKDVKFWRYYIPSTDEIEGWGIFLLDSTGMFAAVTDYGNYAYMWPLRNTGCNDFRDFFDHKDAYYVLGKCAPSRGKEYQGDKTEELIRKTIVQMRRSGSFTEEEAREEWNLLDSIDFYFREGFSQWYEQTNLYDAHEYSVHGYTASEKAFADKLFPRFCEAVAAELKAEREGPKGNEATESPSEAAAG
ncbi:hypothetical protein BK126_03085 [Paenibacillus sp. FSL H7-0326]|uniref:hypothetical protein n=1 Tax=Paenibacillus sp. FSL H7-0326 TaxID=1921144 RepID=UPI00096FAA17|nr:hypothetical protein [Paenibacillus sp. FSL H7-0326]OMC71112.1 hypothetical protein BK126_03085 [Paenibacillus sp. FSL H7-0326]